MCAVISDHHKGEYPNTAPTTTGRAWALNTPTAAVHCPGPYAFDTTAHTALTADRFYGSHCPRPAPERRAGHHHPGYDLPNRLTIYNVTAAGQPTEQHRHRRSATPTALDATNTPCSLHGSNGLSRVQRRRLSGKILYIFTTGFIFSLCKRFNY